MPSQRGGAARNNGARRLRIFARAAVGDGGATPRAAIGDGPSCERRVSDRDGFL